MTEVGVCQLTGGRAPSKNEKELLTGHFKRRIKGYMAFARFYTAFAGIVDLGIVYKLYREYVFLTTKELVLYAILGIVAFLMFANGIRYRVKNRMILQMCASGECTVWECELSKINKNVNALNQAAAKIKTSDGQSCSDWFRVDLTSAKDTEKGIHHNYLLVIFGDQDHIMEKYVISDRLMK
ncbi:MAG: hypothetical protein J6Z22_07365 [Lachnospiraceae bacterium]|nr:hypothetical protein [Lachnospiraceae bacterium]